MSENLQFGAIVVVVLAVVGGVLWFLFSGSATVEPGSDRTTQGRPTNDAEGEASTNDTDLDGRVDDEPETRIGAADGAIPGASIGGVVVDAHGSPMANMYVRARPEETGDAVSGAGDATDDHGRFNLEGLAPGTYSMAIRRIDASTTEIPSGDPVTMARGQVRDGLRLVYSGEDGLTISGRILNQHREPVKDAVIQAVATSGRRGSEVARSGDDGRYTIFGLTGPQYAVSVVHKDYSYAAAEDITAGAGNVDFILIKRASIEGHVVDARTGGPVSKFQLLSFHKAIARVDLYQFGRATICDDPSGAFKIDRIDPGDTTIAVRAEGYAPTLEVIEGVQPGAAVTGVVLRLEEGASIEGVVVDSEGVPQSHVQVRYADVPDLGKMPGEDVAATTDADGRFRINSLGPGAIRLQVNHSPYPVVTKDVELVAGETTPVTIELNSGGAIEGTVRANGMPVAGLTVYANPSQTGNKGTSTTDSEGHYVVPGLSEGAYRVHAIMQDTRNNNLSIRHFVDVRAGMATVADFEYRTYEGIVEGTITAGGSPVARAQVSAVTDGPGIVESVSSHTDQNGYYRIEGAQTGAVKLKVTAPLGSGSMMRVALVDLTPGRSVRCDIDMDAGSRVAGTVSGAARGASISVILLAGAVTVTSAVQYAESAMTSAIVASAEVGQDGSFEFDGIPPGTYTIVAATNSSPRGALTADSVRFVSQVETIGEDGATLNLVIP